jgi:hypothetical protein
MEKSGRNLILSTCMPGFFLFCCLFGGFCPFPLFLSFLGHLIQSSRLVAASWTSAAHESKLSDFKLRLWNRLLSAQALGIVPSCPKKGAQLTLFTVSRWREPVRIFILIAATWLAVSFAARAEITFNDHFISRRPRRFAL